MHEIKLAAAHCEQLPFFRFLGTQSISPADRLTFLPGMAAFVMCLDDIDNLIAHDATGLSPVWSRNGIGADRGHQWQRYVNDLTGLGFDTAASTAQVLSDLACHERRLSRMWTARVAQLVDGAGLSQRLVVARAIEVALGLLLGHAGKVAAALNDANLMQLRFLGQPQFELRAAAKLRPEGLAALEAIELGGSECRRCEELAFLVFDYFADWTSEMLAGAMGAIASRRATRDQVEEGLPWRRAASRLAGDGITESVADGKAGAKLPCNQKVIVELQSQ